MDYLGGLIDQLYNFLVSLGWLGVLGLAFLDSAAVPTGGGPDLAIVLLAGRGMTDFVLLVGAAVVGSTLGCMVMYYIGFRGGEKVLRHFGERRRKRVRDKINKYGFWAIFIAMIGPPPYPTKLFILSSGVFHMRWRIMVLGVFLGRTFRYSFTALIGYRYGMTAMHFFHAHYPIILLGLFILIASVSLVQRRLEKANLRKNNSINANTI